MKINCSQFEGLFSFYLNGELNDKLKTSFEEHLKECSHCNMKFKVLHTIIEDIKEAYKQFNVNDNIQENIVNNQEYVTDTELSAYIDNELPDENSIKIRRNIIAKPKVREKIEQLYKLRKVMSDSFSEHKNRMKTDYSKEIVKGMNKDILDNEAYMHCIGFVLFVITVLCFSIWIVTHCI